jgi:hypothetical protein
LSKLVVYDQNNEWKNWRTKIYKIDKINNPILIDKIAHLWNIFILGK